MTIDDVELLNIAADAVFDAVNATTPAPTSPRKKQTPPVDGATPVVAQPGVRRVPRVPGGKR